MKDLQQNYQKLLNLQLEKLLDEFDGQFDLLNFENEEYVPIEYNLDKILNQFLSNNQKKIEITYKKDSEEYSLTTLLSNSDLEKHFEKILYKCKKSIDGTGLINTYISLGSIKYGENTAPCLFIPVCIEKNQLNYSIFRNYNQEIQFNVLLKIVLKEDYSINLPEFDGDVKEIINMLNNVEGIEYQKNAYISNFDLRFNHIFSDLCSKSWNSFDEKFNQYIDESLCNFKELKKFKQKLLEYSNKLEISDDYLFLKSLLSKNKSILIIGDKSIGNHVKNCFNMIDSESLILELSDELSKENFNEVILDNNLIHNPEVVNLDNLVKKHNQLSNIVKIINQNYSFSSPKQIKKYKDYYLNKINELQIKKFYCELNGVCDYSKSTCRKMHEQVINLFSHKGSFFKWYKYFSINNLSSNKFNSYRNLEDRLEYYLKQFSNFNNYLNKRYSIKIFDNLFSVDVLNNLNVICKSYKYLNDEEIIESNKLLKDCYNDSISSDDIIEIDNNVKYTELIKNEIIDEEKIDLLKNDFENVNRYAKYLIDLSNFLIKEFYHIFDFYNQFTFFDIDVELLNINNSIDDLNKLFFSFKNDMARLVKIKQFLSENVLNRDVEKIVEFILENDFSKNEINVIFWFNIYDSLLNNFLKNYNVIEEEKILSVYESELKDLKVKLSIHNKNLLIQKIYSTPIELNNNQIVSNQKIEFQGVAKDNNSIRELLDKYKEFITANKRIFLMNMASVSQFLSDSYENYFDYVILTDELKYELDALSLLLRSKNKIILLKGDDYE